MLSKPIGVHMQKCGGAMLPNRQIKGGVSLLNAGNFASKGDSSHGLNNKKDTNC